jgi:alcohol dehydrogenase class IV
MKFEFATATRILFGSGTLKEAGPIARSFGTRALLVTGRSSARADGLKKALEAGGVQVISFSVEGEPKVETIQRGTALAREERCQVVVSLGGGSAVDAGKAISAMLTNPGELLDYLEVIGRGNTLPHAAAPFVAIPTTAGTGAEVTRNAVLGSADQHVKVSLRSPLMLPRVALVDPELTYDLPPTVTATTGMDALTQLVEPYVCARPNPMADPLCAEGIRRITRSLSKAYANGANPIAREDMSLASLFGGLALANAGLGAVHGFAGPVGGMFPAPHGAVCAALLPHVMSANIRALRTRQPGSDALERYRHVAVWLTGTPHASAEDGIAWVRALTGELKIPGLSTYGLAASRASDLVEKAIKASSMKANPIVLTREELVAILEAAL